MFDGLRALIDRVASLSWKQWAMVIGVGVVLIGILLAWHGYGVKNVPAENVPVVEE